MLNEIVEWTSWTCKHCRGKTEFGIDRQDVWYLDIGCNNHMCGKKELFS